MLDQVRGMLYGLALGDALGWPVEPLSLGQIRSTYGPQGIQELPEPALFTDDTQMTLAIAEALIKAGDRNLEGLMNAVSRRFVEWLRNPESYRAPGASCLYGASQLARGVPWREAGKLDSKGCGAAMRVAPIGYLYQHDLPRLREVAAATALPTHRHPAAELGAVAGAYLVKLALDRVSPGDFLECLKDETLGLVTDFDQAFRRLEQALEMSDPEAAMCGASARAGWRKRLSWSRSTVFSNTPKIIWPPSAWPPTPAGIRTPWPASPGGSAAPTWGTRPCPRPGRRASRKPRI